MKKEPISGMPPSVDAESTEEVEDVFEARRMKGFRKGKEQYLKECAWIM